MTQEGERVAGNDKHRIVVSTDVLDAISKSVSQTRDATVKRIRRMEGEGAPTDRAKQELRLLTEASQALAEAQVASVPSDE